uniref:Uncharacterized protein n=1 Tax=Pararge aegeria TaxID=116150 RepID=S4PPR4_9NEOP
MLEPVHFLHSLGLRFDFINCFRFRRFLLFRYRWFLARFFFDLCCFLLLCGLFSCPLSFLLCTSLCFKVSFTF